REDRSGLLRGGGWSPDLEPLRHITVLWGDISWWSRSYQTHGMQLRLKEVYDEIGRCHTERPDKEVVAGIGGRSNRSVPVLGKVVQQSESCRDRRWRENCPQIFPTGELRS